MLWIYAELTGGNMVRFAEEHELDRVNELRKQVNDLHVAGKPEIFKPGFPRSLPIISIPSGTIRNRRSSLMNAAG